VRRQRQLVSDGDELAPLLGQRDVQFAGRLIDIGPSLALTICGLA
jgi:hypothetical protein